MKNEDCRNQTMLRPTGIGVAHHHSSFVILLAALCALLTPASFGQSSNRWLFIYETSSSMRARSKAVEDVTHDLLSTGMHGQVQKGDTIGIWTFSDKLRAGDAPLQIWSPESGPTITQHTIQFLRAQQYGKSGSVNGAITNMARVVGGSDIITVFLFTDSEGVINGTPFDDTINQYYKDNYKDLKKADMPMVTVFRGERGYITTNTLNLAPWPVEIPPLPFRAPPKPVVKPHVEPTKPPPPPMAAPIILDGRKPESTPPAENNSPAPNTAPRSEAPVSAPPVAANPESPTSAPAVVISAGTGAVEVPRSSGAMAAAPVQNPPAATETAAANQSPSSSNTIAVASTQPPASGATPGAHSEIQTAASAPAPSLFSPRNILIVSVAFTVLVIGLLVLSARNSRSQASLITRSFDRENQ